MFSIVAMLIYSPKFTYNLQTPAFAMARKGLPLAAGAAGFGADSDPLSPLCPSGICSHDQASKRLLA